MGVIYEPKGKAREYGELALNLYKGCAHGCTYCYAPAATRTGLEVFKDPKPRPDVIMNLEKELKKGQYAGKEVFLCFSCDPYQPVDNIHQLTRQAIKLLHTHEVKVRILTKAGHRGTRDFDLLNARPDLSYYGATLTFTSGQDARLFEPDGALPRDRINALELAHDRGIPTWASLEPVIDPEQTLEIIRLTHPFVDTYKVGRWNYDKRAAAIDWPKFREEVVALLDSLGKDYYIKKDLREAN